MNIRIFNNFIISRRCHFGNKLLSIFTFIILSILLSFLSGCNPEGEAVTIDTSGETLTLEDGFKLTLPPEGVREPLQIKIANISVEEFTSTEADADENTKAARQAAIQALPEDITWHSNIYQLEIEGSPPSQGSLSLPLPAGDLSIDDESLALYGWNGTTWEWLPSQVNQNAGAVVAQLKEMPTLLTVMVIKPVILDVAIVASLEESIPTEAEDMLARTFPIGFHLQTEEPILPAPTLHNWVDTNYPYKIIPSAQNWEENGDPNISTLLETLDNQTTRQRHIMTLVLLVIAGDFDGLQLNYRDLPDESRATFTTFVAGLAEALHTEGLQLFVRVDPPHQVSASNWETGAYDWQTLGKIVDRLQIPAPLDPSDYADGSVKSLLDWATSQVDRRKLDWVVSASNLVKGSSGWAEIPNDVSISHFGTLQASIARQEVSPGEVITISLDGFSENDIQLDESSQLLKFETKDVLGQTQQVWLMSGAGLVLQAVLADEHGLAGLVVEDLPNPITDYSALWPALVNYQTGLPEPKPPSAEIIWNVENSRGLSVSSGKINKSEDGSGITWTVPDERGSYSVEVSLKIGDPSKATPIPVATLNFNVPPPTSPSAPTSTPPPAPTSTPPPTPVSTSVLTSTATPSQEFSGNRTYALVFTKWDGGNHNLYVADTNGNNEQVIISKAAGPSWTPMGEAIFFFGESSVERQIIPDGREYLIGGIGDGIVRMETSPLSTNIEQLRLYQSPNWDIGTALWTNVSPDGTIVSFGDKLGGNNRILFLDVANTQKLPFEIDGEQGDWSPDSQKLVYRSGRDNIVGLWISNRNGTGHKNITNNGTDSFPAWSPDGRKIAFSREVDGNWDIYIMNTDGSNLERLTSVPGHDILPTYTPDGQIIFRSTRDGSWGIWKMGGDGLNQSKIIANAAVGPDWTQSKMDVSQ